MHCIAVPCGSGRGRPAMGGVHETCMHVRNASASPGATPCFATAGSLVMGKMSVLTTSPAPTTWHRSATIEADDHQHSCMHSLEMSAGSVVQTH